VTHRVEAGQTVFSIAKQYGLTVEELSAANGITDPRSLRVGQELAIPQKESEIESRTISPPRSSPLAESTAVLQWPLRGVLYAKFGLKGKQPHDGIDLAAPLGSPIKTAAAGTVLYAGEQAGYGKVVIIDHAGGLVTIYAHNRDLRVSAGKKLKEGEVIATVGESGRTSGPHLHFEVRKAGRPVDPLKFLPSSGP
jgi:lipoprotein NlpD